VIEPNGKFTVVANGALSIFTLLLYPKSEHRGLASGVCPKVKVADKVSTIANTIKENVFFITPIKA
jgi:hypothetical protein